MAILANQRHELFCQGIAAGKSAAQSYIDAGYSRNGATVSASRLLAKANVRARVDELKLKVSKAIEIITIAEKETRIKILDDLQSRMQRLFAARALDMADIPGGETGLIVRQIKSIGFGKNNKTVEEYAFDAALVREARATLEQVAQETDTKRPVDESGIKPSGITYRWAQPDEVAAETPAGSPAEDKPAETHEQVQ
jgi:hypothetical protein